MYQLIIFPQHSEETVYGLYCRLCHSLYSDQYQWDMAQCTIGPIQIFPPTLFIIHGPCHGKSSDLTTQSGCRLKECLGLQRQIFWRLKVCGQSCEASCIGAQLHHLELNAERFAIQCFFIPNFPLCLPRLDSTTGHLYIQTKYLSSHWGNHQTHVWRK